LIPARFFYNAGEGAEALNAYQRALSKLVNSLSWGREVINPEPIGPESTIFHIARLGQEMEEKRNGRVEGWKRASSTFHPSMF